MLPALCVAQKEVFADAAMSIDPGTFHLLHCEYRFVLNGFVRNALVVEKGVNFVLWYPDIIYFSCIYNLAHYSAK